MSDLKAEQEYKLNFGPQHPAAHGSLRLILTLNGEIIKKVEPEIGFLHRAIEKLAENNFALQIIPYFDRLDYISSFCNEHAYVLAVEKLVNIVPPIRAQYIRVMFAEINRLLSHLLWLGTYALDLGAISGFLYCFREREDLLDCCEAVSGARMHPCYYRVGGVARDLPDSMPKYANNTDKRNRNRKGKMLDFLADFTERFPGKIAEYESLLTKNRIWKQRTQNIGVLTKEQALEYGCSGPVLRSTGIEWDLRKQQPYDIYEKLKFTVPIGNNGDCYDRYLIRIEEMRQSNNIIRQCIEWLQNHPGPVLADNNKIVAPAKQRIQTEMEAMIHHCKLFTKGHPIGKGEIYTAVEHPKGEFGVYILADGTNKPYRLKIRSASFAHLFVVDLIAKNHMLSNLIAIFGGLDIVMGEVDR